MKYLRRLIWFIATRLMVVLFVGGLMISTFYYAMNMANLYVVLKDGMANRAQVVMMGEDEEVLSKYFSQSFLERDAVLQSVHQGTNPYQDYNVRGIDHRLSMSFTWMWPWDESVRVVITERIPSIDGRAKGTRAQELVTRGGASALYPPKWQSARYTVIAIKQNGQWRIQSLSMAEALREE